MANANITNSGELDEQQKIPYPELARLARKTILDSLGKGEQAKFSLRQVANKTSLTHSTISTLLAGRKVSPHTLERFARAYKISANPFLIAMGEEPIPESLVDAYVAVQIKSTHGTSTINTLDEVKLKDGRKVIISGFEASREDKELVKALIRRFMNAKQ